MSRKRPNNGELYYHFKGKMYQVIGVATHSETREELVIYQALYGNFKTYARPLDMFLSEVDSLKYPDVKQKYRFTRVNVDEFGNKIFVEEDFANKTSTNEQDHVIKIAKEPEYKRVIDNTIKTNSNTLLENEEQVEKPKIEVSTNFVEENLDEKYKEEKVVPRRKSSVFDFSKKTEEKVEQEYVVPEGVNPKLIEFLDSDSYEERYNILVSLRDEITDKLVDDIAVSIDVVIPEGPLWQRYDDLKSALRLRQKYEFANRLRR